MPRDRHARTDQLDRPGKIDPTLHAEPIDRTEPPDLIFRSERDEPTERSDRTGAFSQPFIPAC